MWDKLKQGKQLLDARNQAAQMQKKLAEITESVDIGTYHVKVGADQKVHFIGKDDERMEDLEKAINMAFERVQKKAAEKMLAEEGLSGLLEKLGGK
jgi:DNA-binding protein YbaB